MTHPDPSEPVRAMLCAFADGETDRSESLRALQAWAAGDRAAGEAWHAYHLIGDVLRSDELASAPARDEAFLARLRQRLADEAPLAAPVTLLAPVPAARRWWGRPQGPWPLAVAAGLGALATALLVQRGETGGGDSSRALAVTSAPVVAQAASAAAPMATAGMVRDAQLDRYLRAHREYGVAQPVSLPGAARHGGIEAVAFER